MTYEERFERIEEDLQQVVAIQLRSERRLDGHEERFGRIEEDLRQVASNLRLSERRFHEERDALWEALGRLAQNVNALTDRLDQRITALAEQHSLLQADLRALINQLRKPGGNGHVTAE